MSKEDQNKFKEDIVNIDNSNVSNDIDILIREEAILIAQNYLNENQYSINSDINRNFDYNDDFQTNENNDVLQRIEKKLDFFNKKIEEMNFDDSKVFLDNNKKTINDIKNILTKNNDDLNKIYNQLSNDIDGNDDTFLNDEEALLKKFENLENISNDSNNNQQDNSSNFNNDIALIKNNIDDFIKNTTEINRNILFDTVDNNQKVFKEVKNFRKNYENVELELKNIYSTWVENNKLFGNLESLLYDIANFDKLSNDQNSFNEVFSNSNLLNELLNLSNELKKEISSLEKRVSNIENCGDLLPNNNSINNSNIYQNLSNLDERISLIENSNISNQSEINDSIFDSINEINYRLSNNSESVSENGNIIEYNPLINEERIRKISLDVFNEQIHTNKELHELIISKSNSIDSIIDSNLFNLTLEKMIDAKCNNMRLTEKDREEIILSISNSDRLRTMATSEIQYISNDVKMDLTSKIVQFKEAYNEFENEVNSKLIKLESKIDNSSVKLEQHEIIEMVFASKELENIIQDKMIYVINDKLNELKESVLSIEMNVINNINNYLSKNIKEDLKREIIDSNEVRIKIKNDALNAVYKQINERDKIYETQRNDMMNSYQALIENNKILENIEQLIFRQVEEVEGFRKDKENSFDLLLEKVGKHKREINDLKEKIVDMSGWHMVNNYHTSSNNYRDFDIYENVKDITSNLVKNEIKKMNLINDGFDQYNSSSNVKNYEQEQNENQFFKNRIAEILSKLEENKYYGLDEINIEIDEDKSMLNAKELSINMDDIINIEPINVVKDDEFDLDVNNYSNAHSKLNEINNDKEENKINTLNKEEPIKKHNSLDYIDTEIKLSGISNNNDFNFFDQSIESNQSNVDEYNNDLDNDINFEDDFDDLNDDILDDDFDELNIDEETQ